MDYKFKILTTITNDGKIIQEVHGSDYEKIIHYVIDTQKRHISDALVVLGWTPPTDPANTQGERQGD